MVASLQNGDYHVPRSYAILELAEMPVSQLKRQVTVIVNAGA